MIEVLEGYLDAGWKKKEQVLRFIKHMTGEAINERAWRSYVEEFNRKYEDGETELFIAHSNEGYRLTTDPKIILASLEDDRKRGTKLLRRYYRCKKAIAEKSQLALTPTESDMYEVLMKVEL